MRHPRVPPQTVPQFWRNMASSGNVLYYAFSDETKHDMNNPVKAYIFDMDGTLVDNCSAHVVAWQKFSKEHGHALTKRQILDWMGAQASFYVEKIFGGELPPDEVTRLCEEKEALYRKIYKPVLPDGLREWLDYARVRKVPCALATGGSKANVDFVLDSLSLRDYFSAVVDGSMYSRSKPDPECFLMAAEMLGVEPAFCRVYEDAVNGVAAARAAGMRVVAVTFTNPREVLEEAGANRVIDSYRELDIWPVRKDRTPEDDAAIACLDRLRACADEERPSVPLACVVRVTDVEDVPKANERYAMASVEAAGARKWRVCVVRGTVERGDDALFVTPDVALPDERRFRDSFRVKERVYKYGFGASERVLLPHVSRCIYRNNSGLLCPISKFKELRPRTSEADVMRLLKLQPVAELLARTQCSSKPKAKHVFRPGAAVKKALKSPMTFLEKVRRHRLRFEAETRDA